MAPAALAGHPITFRIAHGHKEVVEGPDFEDVMMLEFPTFWEARAWYDSPAYQAASEHRFKGADYRAIIVEGVPPKSSWVCHMREEPPASESHCKSAIS
jgi:uncharacterized protein (DUF1330 family)